MKEAPLPCDHNNGYVCSRTVKACRISRNSAREDAPWQGLACDLDAEQPLVCHFLS